MYPSMAFSTTSIPSSACSCDNIGLLYLTFLMSAASLGMTAYSLLSLRYDKAFMKCAKALKSLVNDKTKCETDGDVHNSSSHLQPRSEAEAGYEDMPALVDDNRCSQTNIMKQSKLPTEIDNLFNETVTQNPLLEKKKETSSMLLSHGRSGYMTLGDLEERNKKYQSGTVKTHNNSVENPLKKSRIDDDDHVDANKMITRLPTLYFFNNLTELEKKYLQYYRHILRFSKLSDATDFCQKDGYLIYNMRDVMNGSNFVYPPSYCIIVKIVSEETTEPKIVDVVDIRKGLGAPDLPPEPKGYATYT